MIVEPHSRQLLPYPGLCVSHSVSGQQMRYVDVRGRARLSSIMHTIHSVAMTSCSLPTTSLMVVPASLCNQSILLR